MTAEDAHPTARADPSRHADLAPSPWVRRWSHLVPTGASVLDVACGAGRHVRWFAARGCRVTGIDRDAAALEALEPIAEVHVADIEKGAWPLHGARFDAVVCTNYLWRPLLPTLVASVAESGILIYETFSAGNESVGRPSNSDFLLRPGELLGLGATLRTIAFEEGFCDAPERFVQRLVATRDDGAEHASRRWILAAG